MGKFLWYVNEITKQWQDRNYFVVDLKNNKSVITNINGLMVIANKYGIEMKLLNKSNIDSLEHDLGCQLESLSIYFNILQKEDEIESLGIEHTDSLERFLGE